MSLSALEFENQIGSTSMHTAANTNLFIVTASSSFKQLAEFDKRFINAGLYQAVAQTLITGFHNRQSSVDLAARLASVADHAYLIRQFDIVGYIGQLLLRLPLPSQLQSVGQYFQALSLNRGTLGDTARTGKLFEQVADNASAQYRARAMLSLGGNSLAVGDHRTAMSFYRDVGRIATRNRAIDAITVYGVSRMRAVMQAVEGDHARALDELERMLPLARMASMFQPYAYYDYLNTLAVELTEAGRLEEARNASGIALASPFASAYPEWRETRDEIELGGWRASRSRVAFNKRTSNKSTSEAENLVRMCVPERGDNASCKESIAAHTEQRARVLDLLEWKKKMGKEPNGTPHDKSYKDMDGREMLLKIMELTGARDRTDDELLEILEAIERIFSARKAPGK